MGQAQGKPTFRVLTSTEAEQELIRNNRLDHYDTACLMNRVNSLAAQRVEPCAAPEGLKRAIGAIKLPPWLAADLAGVEVNIAFFKEGLPHTRAGNTIWLPSSLRDMEITFIHECIHISQRLWPDKWNAAYAAVWNMTPTAWPPVPYKRFNPDTFKSTAYKWTAPSGATWTPVLVFMNPDAPKLTETRLLFVGDQGGWQSTPPTEWMQTFRGADPSICEHPHEMAAYTLSTGSGGALEKYLVANNR
jgi:hypothetical protein